MSGHSKWAKIKRQKGVNDQARGVLFAKLGRMITLAVIEGGGIDPNLNVRLRLAIEKAKSENTPKENIERAIEKGGGADQLKLKEVHYEAFGPEGVALYITASTDNSNRTNAEIRNTLERNGGKVGGQGATAYLFTQLGMVTVSKEVHTEDEIFEIGDTLNVIDIDEDETSITIFFPFEILGKAKERISNKKTSIPEQVFRSLTSVTVSSSEIEEKVIHLVSALEELDDVHAVYTNMEFIN
ncbi:MAG: YebC/PmpR family DNA-binding transcriptional regulator [Candidatus Roizmanbacteria bacterium]